MADLSEVLLDLDLMEDLLELLFGVLVEASLAVSFWDSVSHCSGYYKKMKIVKWPGRMAWSITSVVVSFLTEIVEPVADLSEVLLDLDLMEDLLELFCGWLTSSVTLSSGTAWIAFDSGWVVRIA